MPRVPDHLDSVNLRLWALENGLPIPDWPEEFDTDCAGFGFLLHYLAQSSVVYTQARCWKCWECRVRKLRRIIREERRNLRHIELERGPLYFFRVQTTDWLSRHRRALIRAGAGWRATSAWGETVGYTDLGGLLGLTTDEIVRDSNLVPFIRKNCSAVLHLKGTTFDDRTIDYETLPYRRQSGGTFKGIYLGKRAGGRMLRGTLSEHKFLSTAEKYEGVVSRGRSPWDTTWLDALFADPLVSIRVVKELAA